MFAASVGCAHLQPPPAPSLARRRARVPPPPRPSDEPLIDHLKSRHLTHPPHPPPFTSPPLVTSAPSAGVALAAYGAHRAYLAGLEAGAAAAASRSRTPPARSSPPDDTSADDAPDAEDDRPSSSTDADAAASALARPDSETWEVDDWEAEAAKAAGALAVAAAAKSERERAAAAADGDSRDDDAANPAAADPPGDRRAAASAASPSSANPRPEDPGSPPPPPASASPVIKGTPSGGTPPGGTPPGTPSGTPSGTTAPPPAPSPSPLGQSSSPPPFGAAYASTPPGASASISSSSSAADPSSAAAFSSSSSSLTAAYDKIQGDFERDRTFDSAAVAESRRHFHFEEGGAGVWPTPYQSRGLPRDCARLLLLTLEDAPAVAAAGAACAREVCAALGKAAVPAFTVARSAYHVSAFFLSLPSDPVEDPLTPGGGGGEDEKRPRGRRGVGVGGVSLDLDVAPLTAVHGRFAPDHDAEEAALRAALEGADAESDFESGSNPNPNADPNPKPRKGRLPLPRGPVELEVDRVAFASSGALLLMFRDPAGRLGALREALREVFPGAPARQSAIAHCTLLRAFPDAPDQACRAGTRAGADVVAACKRWSARLRGTKVVVGRAWLVREERFSSVDGAKTAFKL